MNAPSMMPDWDDSTMLSWIDNYLIREVNAAGRADHRAVRRELKKLRPSNGIDAAKAGELDPLAAALRRHDPAAIEFAAQQADLGGGVFRSQRIRPETRADKQAVEAAKQIREIWKREFGTARRAKGQSSAEELAALYLDRDPSVIIRRRRKGR